MSDDVMDERGNLFHNNELSDDQLVAALNWVINDMTRVKESIARTKASSYGNRGKDSTPPKRAMQLLGSIISTLNKRRSVAKELYEGTAEHRLLNEIFGAGEGKS